MFFMMDRFKLLASKISMVLFEITNAPEMISVTDLNNLNDVIYLLKPLELVTKEISGQNYITTSKVIPLAHTIKSKVENLTPTSEIGIALQLQLLSQIDKWFNKMEHSHMLAMNTVLDPRFKTIHFKLHVAKANSIQYVNKELRKLLKSENHAVTPSLR